MQKMKLTKGPEAPPQDNLVYSELQLLLKRHLTSHEIKLVNLTQLGKGQFRLKLTKVGQPKYLLMRGIIEDFARKKRATFRRGILKLA